MADMVMASLVWDVQQLKRQVALLEKINENQAKTIASQSYQINKNRRDAVKAAENNRIQTNHQAMMRRIGR